MKKMKRFYIGGFLLAASVAVAHAGLLEEGREAYRLGKYEEAYDLFSKAFREDPLSVEVNFLLGEAAWQKKKYSHAVFAYDRVLTAVPAHQKARYGKARALLALGQTEEARAEFNTLLAADLAPEVRAGLEGLVDQMDRLDDRWRLEGSVSIAMFYDDNVNFGPAEEVINVLNGTMALNPGSTPDDAWGASVSVSGTASYDAGSRGGWVAIGGASLYSTFLDSASAQETLYARLFAGARHVQSDRITELTARYDRLDYGHDHLLDIYGLDAVHLRVLNRSNHLIGRLSVEHRDYDTDVSNNGRDSIYTAAQAGWRHFFANRRNRIELTAGLFSDYAREEVNRNYGGLLKAGGEVELPFQIIGYASGQYRRAMYEDNMKGVFADAREDDQFDWITGVRRPVSRNWTVDLHHRFIRNDSNLGLYDYERRLVTLSATYKF